MAVVGASARGLGTTFSRLVERLVPVGMDETEHHRAVLLVSAWLPVFVFCAVTSAWFSFTRSWAMVTLLLGAAVFGVGAIVLTRFTRRATLAVHLSLTVGSVFFAASGLMQTPPDPTAPTVIIVAPLAASLVFGRRAAWSYVAYCTVVIVTALALASKGYSMPFPDQVPLVTQALNFVYAMIIVLVCAQAASRIQDRVIEEQRAAAKAKSRFLANISHEIRTPMHGVLGMTEALLATPDFSPETRERVGVIHRSGQHMVSLINDLLDLSKIEAGKLTLSPSPTELRQLLLDVAALFEPLAARKGVRFELSVDDRAPEWISIDAARLKQVLTNLASNAVKFTERGAISLTVTSLGDRLRFSVRDTGPGIAPETLPRLFSAFEQGDPSTTRKHGGTGLGLALSRQIVALLQGSLEVESTVGVGTTFSFEVPARPARKPEQLAQLTNLSLAARLTVLVVDDNVINRRVAEGLLERAGYQVRSASNGKEALELVRAQPIDAVLMDCHMPVMDGFEATTQIRQLGGTKGQLPIIAVTASTTSEDREACVRAGMNECLVKPVSSADLLRVLAGVTSQAGAARAE